jgi:S1-C subfamily serine protease
MSMRRRVRWAGVALAVATLGGANVARAADWAPSAVGPGGLLYETEVSSITRQGTLVRSWDRTLLAHPARDPTSGKAYVAEIEERFDDCANHRFQMGSYVRRDAKGEVVYSGSSLSSGWQQIVPGSVAEGLSRLACAAANPPAAAPIQADLREGSWTDLGGASDGSFHLQVRIDGVRKLDSGPVIAVSRSVYETPQPIDGFLVRYVVTGTAIDCAAGTSAILATDLFVSPTVRVKSTRVSNDDVRFEKAGPKSFLAKSLALICAAASPIKPREEPSGFSVGTAWGVDKGYLVTASHVIEGGGRIEVYSNGEKVGVARVVADDPANDLAILKYAPSKPGKLVILPISTRPAALGRSVFTLGYPEPDALGQRVKMTAGQVSSTAGYQDDARFLQISVPIQQGNSGGPLIGWDGSVLGVIESKLTRFSESPSKLTPEMVNYALKASYLRPMLDDLPDLANYTVIKPISDNAQMVEEARKAVFMVVVIPAR